MKFLFFCLGLLSFSQAAEAGEYEYRGKACVNMPPDNHQECVSARTREEFAQKREQLGARYDAAMRKVLEAEAEAGDKMLDQLLKTLDKLQGN